MNFWINKEVMLTKVRTFVQYVRKTVVYEFFVNPAMLTAYVAIIGIMVFINWPTLQASVIQQQTQESSTEIKPSRPDFTAAQLQITQDYASESVSAFFKNPHSKNLDNVAHAFFSARLEGTRPSSMLSRYGDCPKEFKDKMGLLLKYTRWFTDYVYESPNFKYGPYRFQYDHEFGSDENAKWTISGNGYQKARVTWGQIVCLVMGIEYDSQYDQALVVYSGGKPTNPEDRPNFIGPKA